MVALVAYLQFGEKGGPYLTQSVPVREVTSPRSGATLTGYGARMPAPYMVRYLNRWRRVYCANYSNSGVLFIGRNFADGVKVQIEQEG